MMDGKRAYRSTLRAEQAERTKAAVIAAATECFIERGYAETTMKDIAARAGVSAQTVYAQGSKAALLLTAVDHSVVGDAAPEPLIERDRFRELLAERDKETKLRLLHQMALDTPPTLGPILRCFREAAPGDPELAEAWQEYERRRYADARVLMESFAHLLRPGVTVERATDIGWALTASQMSDALMRDREWSWEDFADWLIDALDRLLLH